MARKIEYTDRVGLGHIRLWTESWGWWWYWGEVIVPEEGRMGANRKNHQMSRSGLFLFSGCLHFSLSPCLPLPLPNLALMVLGGEGYLLSGAWA